MPPRYVPLSILLNQSHLPDKNLNSIITQKENILIPKQLMSKDTDPTQVAPQNGFNIDKMYDDVMTIGPCKNICQMRLVVNTFKALTPIYCLALMTYFQNFSTATVVYTGLHGSYGIIWLLKDIITPDETFKKPVSFFGSISVSVCLAAYWYPFYVLASDSAALKCSEISLERLLVAMIMFNVGVFMMVATDVQKTVSLEYMKQIPNSPKTITTAYFKHSRSLNYLGEVLVYTSYVVIPGDTQLYLTYFAIMFCTMLIGFVKKELSYRRKPEWTWYKEDTLSFLPRIFSGNGSELREQIGSTGHALFNYALWYLVFVGGYKLYNAGGIFSILKS
jgi:hypothetical protein